MKTKTDKTNKAINKAYMMAISEVDPMSFIRMKTVYFSTGGPASLTISSIEEDDRVIAIEDCLEDDIDAVMVTFKPDVDIEKFADDYDGYWGYTKEGFLNGTDEK